MAPALKIVPEQYDYEYETLCDEQIESVSRETQRRVVSAAPRKQANPFVVLPLAALLLLGAGLLFVSQRVQLMEMTYELEAVQQRLVKLQRDQARLLVAKAQAASLETLETTARTRLGMVAPAGVTTVVVAPDEATTALASSGASPSLLATVGTWLQQRLTTTAEAGERPR